MGIRNARTDPHMCRASGDDHMGLLRNRSEPSQGRELPGIEVYTGHPWVLSCIFVLYVGFCPVAKKLDRKHIIFLMENESKYLYLDVKKYPMS